VIVSSMPRFSDLWPPDRNSALELLAKVSCLNRLRLLASDVLDSLDVGDPDLINDCLLHLHSFLDETLLPTELPQVLDDVLLACRDLLESDGLRSSALLVLASLTSIPTTRFTSAVTAHCLEVIVEVVAGGDEADAGTAAVLLSNLCCDDRSLFDVFRPTDVTRIVNESPFSTQTKCCFAAIFSSVCCFTLSDPEGAQLMNCIVSCIASHVHEIELVDELFLAISRLRKHTENYLRIVIGAGLFAIPDLHEISVNSLSTLLQVLGEAIQEGVEVDVDFRKLVKLSQHSNRTVAATALWLLGNWLDGADHNELAGPQFVRVLFEIGEEGTFEMAKLTVLIWSQIVMEAPAAQLCDLLCVPFLEKAGEVLADERDDVEFMARLSELLVRIVDIAEAGDVAWIGSRIIESGIMAAIEAGDVDEALITRMATLKCAAQCHVTINVLPSRSVSGIEVRP
jgi:hypothetical protein